MNNNDIKSIVEAVIEQTSCIGSITLEAAKRLAARVEEKARETGVNAVVAVADAAAHPVLIECMDGAFIASYDIAVNKAFTVVSLKMSTTELKTLAQPGGSLYGIQFTNGGRIVIFGGGVPLVHNGRIIGGLGVSGGTEEQDTGLAEYGARILGDII